MSHGGLVGINENGSPNFKREQIIGEKEKVKEREKL